MMRRLLIIDDEPGVSSIIRFIAEDIGFEVDATDQPAEFFDLLKRHPPSHIAVDLLMPELDGVEILRALADHGSEAQIIVTSGMGRRVLDAALRAGSERGLRMCGVLPKPFLPDTLRDLLNGSAAALHEDTGVFLAKDLTVTEATLSEAVQLRQLRMVFQPKVTPGLEVRGMEALMRWRHPKFGEVRPAYFIAAAERHGVIQDMTAQAFDQSVQWLSQQRRAEGISVAVNLSVRDIEDIGLVDSLAWSCAEHGVSPERIVLELTETSAMHNPANALDVLTRLRMRGFRLSLDDFGTGYSSMKQLARMPFSEIKIDRSFVATVLESKESLTIVRTIVDLAHNLELQAVAEGIEDEPTFRLLRDMGCDLLQGYYIARPMEAGEASAWLGRPVQPGGAADTDR